MFLENASRKGWIEIICGSMFSGKTEELIRRLKRANLAHHSHRLTSDEKQVMLGAQDSYEAICRHCFNKLTNNGKA